MGTAAQKLCFVVGPIGWHRSSERGHADTLLKKIIKPTFAKHFRTFKLERADHIARPGMIDSQVITHLIEADLVIADLTTRNANAFYELGIRHMLQKPVIHLYRRGDVVPADIAPYRAIEFDYENKEDVRDAKIALRKMIREVFLPHFIVENPVTRSAGFMLMREKEQHQTNKRGRSSIWRFGRPTASLHDAPGIVWTKKGDAFTATWMASRDVLRRGYPLKGLRIWSGIENDLSKTARLFITDRANSLQQDMLVWDNVIG